MFCGSYRRRVFEVVVLDAMGVLYVEPDDVGQILLPFLAERKLHAGRGPVESLYVECSWGRFSSEELWRRLGVTTEADTVLFGGGPGIGHDVVSDFAALRIYLDEGRRALHED
jgi:hypothetical protein